MPPSALLRVQRLQPSAHQSESQAPLGKPPLYTCENFEFSCLQVRVRILQRPALTHGTRLAVAKCPLVSRRGFRGVRFPPIPAISGYSPILLSRTAALLRSCTIVIQPAQFPLEPKPAQMIVYLHIAFALQHLAKLPGSTAVGCELVGAFNDVGLHKSCSSTHSKAREFRRLF